MAMKVDGYGVADRSVGENGSRGQGGSVAVHGGDDWAFVRLERRRARSLET